MQRLRNLRQRMKRSDREVAAERARRHMRSVHIFGKLSYSWFALADFLF